MASGDGRCRRWSPQCKRCCLICRLVSSFTRTIRTRSIQPRLSPLVFHQHLLYHSRYLMRWEEKRRFWFPKRCSLERTQRNGTPLVCRAVCISAGFKQAHSVTRRNSFCSDDGQLQLTKGTTTLPLSINDYCGRSIVFAACWFAAPAANK